MPTGQHSGPAQWTPGSPGQHRQHARAWDGVLGTMETQRLALFASWPPWRIRVEGAQSGQVVWQISFQSLRSLNSCFRNTYYAWGPSQPCWPAPQLRLLAGTSAALPRWGRGVTGSGEQRTKRAGPSL